MHEGARMEMSLSALAGWVLGLGGMVAVAGAWPTYRLAGWAGVQTELVALAVVGLVMMATGAWVAVEAFRGPVRAAVSFLVAGVVRLPACLGGGALLWWLAELPAVVLGLWMAVFYLAMLAGEGVWIVRALRRDAHRTALGDVRRPTKS